MSTGIIVIIIVVAIVAAGVLLVLGRRFGGQHGLKKRFGPEYDRVLAERGDRKQAEAELLAREQRVHDYQLRELAEQMRDTYEAQWLDTQERFVEAPGAALADAHELIQSVLIERGYPASAHDQMVADLSVHHAQVIEEYRSAYEIGQRADEASTEEQRIAMLNYRTLFSQLLGGQVTPVPRALAATTNDQLDRS